MRYILSLMIFVTCTFCNQISADEYWVVASLTNQQAALREVSRLSTETGMIVEVSTFSKEGKHYHRLLIAARDIDAGLRQQLTDMGIESWLISLDPTRVSLPDTQPVPWPDATDYLQPESPSDGFISSGSGQFLFVVASYHEVELALDAESKLSSIFPSVRGETVLMNGQIFHRVLVGPINFDEIEPTRLSLVGAGFENVWLVNGVVDDAIDEVNVNLGTSEPPVMGDVSIIVEAIKMPSKPSNPSGFNLARLPEKNPEFEL